MLIELYSEALVHDRYDVPSKQLPLAPGFNVSIHLDLAGLDHDFGLSTRTRPTLNLEKLLEMNALSFLFRLVHATRLLSEIDTTETHLPTIQCIILAALPWNLSENRIDARNSLNRRVIRIGF